jgi:hypothetical protein
LFTNEFKFDKSVTTLLDETGQNSDVIITIDNDSGYVYIEQDDGEDLLTNLICIPPHMFKELFEALHSTEGAYRLIER